MSTTKSKHARVRLGAGFKAALAVGMVGLIAAITEATLVESREARRLSAATEPAAEVQPYYFPSQFSIGDAEAAPHVEAF